MANITIARAPVQKTDTQKAKRIKLGNPPRLIHQVVRTHSSCSFPRNARPFGESQYIGSSPHGVSVWRKLKFSNSSIASCAWLKDSSIAFEKCSVVSGSTPCFPKIVKISNALAERSFLDFGSLVRGLLCFCEEVINSTIIPRTTKRATASESSITGNRDVGNEPDILKCRRADTVAMHTKIVESDISSLARSGKSVLKIVVSRLIISCFYCLCSSNIFSILIMHLSDSTPSTAM